jgi:hypothetical protein
LRAEKKVPGRNLTGEILVIGFWLIGVMPMVKARRGDHPRQRTKINPRIGMQQH